MSGRVIAKGAVAQKMEREWSSRSSPIHNGFRSHPLVRFDVCYTAGRRTARSHAGSWAKCLLLPRNSVRQGRTLALTQPENESVLRHLAAVLALFGPPPLSFFCYSLGSARVLRRTPAHTPPHRHGPQAPVGGRRQGKPVPRNGRRKRRGGSARRMRFSTSTSSLPILISNARDHPLSAIRSTMSPPASPPRNGWLKPRPSPSKRMTPTGGASSWCRTLASPTRPPG